MKTKLTDAELWQTLAQAESIKHDKTLDIAVRIRSAETIALCLREAANRGMDYAALRTAGVPA